MNSLNGRIIGSAVETEYSKSISLEHRKKFAQFFTPISIAELMVRWLMGNKNLKTVLEPAFGLGIFSRALLAKKNDIQINGFEIDDIIFTQAKKEFAGTEKINLLLEDYMFNDWDNKYDGIICNPPYFKFHDYDNKNILTEFEKRLKCKLNGFTNLYTLFLLKSICQLKFNGRCAYIVPSEFLNSDYGKLVKRHLIETGSLRHIIVFNFEENVFEDALTTASIILCAKDNKMKKMQFTNIRSINELSIVEKLITDYPNLSVESTTYSFLELNPDIKWKTYYQRQNAYNFKNLIAFSAYAKVVRGIATGNNNYFTFNIAKAQKYKIDERFLLPCICKAIDVKGNNFSYSDFEKLKNSNKNVFLLNAVNTKDENVARYLQKGQDENIDKKFLTASRHPWYSLEKRFPSPIWVSVFNRTGLRFIRNEANIFNLTTFHCVYPQIDIFTNISVDLLFAYLLTDTARQIFEDNSREYGNGLQKFEPNDLNKGKILDLEKLSKSTKETIIDSYQNYSRTDDRQYINKIDIIFQEEFNKRF
ncbi:MAG: N-6 DNA methylase [Planctomycetaceae bacterium]|jgi:adenine-specific DNA-methyltransferase|nr:N-6 DNA methylase [Planctomycetaceae bacterium]